MSTWIHPDDARQALLESRGEGIRVAILDSGIETAHPVFTNVSFADDLTFTSGDHSVRYKNNEGVDVFGHGTAVASVLLGTAPGVTIGSFQVLGGAAHGRDEAVRYAALEAIKRGYHIIHCSLGSAGTALTIMPFKEWIDAAYVAGTHVVAAAHKSGIRSRVWPAHFTSVVGVSAVASASPDHHYFNPQHLVGFGARGRIKISLPWKGGGERLFEGTSFTAPIVTGLLARLLSAYPHLQPDTAKSLLREIAQPWPSGESAGLSGVGAEAGS